LCIANALEPLKVVKAYSNDLLIPAEAEFVLEGRAYLKERHAEGPFVDLTETYDVIREEPVFEVKKITHRKDAIWQALLPGALEHKILMGMPREPTIFNKVNESGVKCLDVNVSPGGCSWLHAIIQIDKKSEEDGKKAIEAQDTGRIKKCLEELQQATFKISEALYKSSAPKEAKEGAPAEEPKQEKKKRLKTQRIFQKNSILD
jgi:UbiD family decarboxylase